MNYHGKTSSKYSCTCCALGIFSFRDDTPDHELDWHISFARESAKKHWTPDNRDGDETAFIVITTPSEHILEGKLKARNFKVITQFSRRNGYPKTGSLKMWFLDLLK